MNLQKIYIFFQKRLSPPRVATLIVGIVLWIFGVAGYFWIPLSSWVTISALILATVILFIASILEEI